MPSSDLGGKQGCILRPPPSPPPTTALLMVVGGRLTLGIPTLA